MTVRSWVGVVLAVCVFALFGMFIHEGRELTAVWGFAFGGGLLFAGLLIDPAEFRAVLGVFKRSEP